MVEALIEESIQSFRDGTLERFEELEVNAPEISMGEAAKDDFIPDEGGHWCAADRKPGVGCGLTAITQPDVVENVELRTDPALASFVPPSIVVIKRDASPAVQ